MRTPRNKTVFDPTIISRLQEVAYDEDAKYQKHRQPMYDKAILTKLPSI